MRAGGTRPEHHLGHPGDESRARLRDEHAGLARRRHIDVADIDRAAQERHQLWQALEERSRRGRLAVGDDEIAVSGGGDERFAFERRRAVVQLHLSQFAQAGERALAVIQLARLGGMSQQYSHARKMVTVTI
jgi:hypothetical protein